MDCNCFCAVYLVKAEYSIFLWQWAGIGGSMEAAGIGLPREIPMSNIGLGQALDDDYI